MFKVNNKNTRTVVWCFIVNFENISHLSLVSLLLTLNKQMLTGIYYLDYSLQFSQLANFLRRRLEQFFNLAIKGHFIISNISNDLTTCSLFSSITLFSKIYISFTAFCSKAHKTVAALSRTFRFQIIIQTFLKYMRRQVFTSYISRLLTIQLLPLTKSLDIQSVRKQSFIYISS